MPDLTFDYEEALTQDPQSVLDAVLAAARRFCGWHVSPVLTDTVRLNGTGGRRLFVKTKRLLTLDSVSEDGEPLEVGVDVVADPETPGMLFRPNSFWKPGTSNIEVTFTHGYVPEEAADWRLAVMRMTRQRLSGSNRDSADMKRKRIDDVEYEWFESAVSDNAELAAAFSAYRLIPAP